MATVGVKGLTRADFVLQAQRYYFVLRKLSDGI